MRRFLPILVVVALALALGAVALASYDGGDHNNGTTNVLKDIKPFPVKVSGNCRDGYTVTTAKDAPSGIAEVILKDNSENNALWWITKGDTAKAVAEVTIGSTPAGYTTRSPLIPGALNKARRLWVRGVHDNDEYTGINELKLSCT